MQTQCSARQFEFEAVERRSVVAAFDGGAVSSDAGALLLSGLDRGLGLIERFAGCFDDRRDPELIEHSVKTLVGQRVLGLALGYEDLIDHDELRHDPLWAAALGKLEPKRRSGCAALAGKSTLNRLERTPHSTRYHKIGHRPEAIEKLFVELFLDAYAQPPEQIVLDLDAMRRSGAWRVRRGGSSTATTGTTVICRCTSSAASTCWWRSCGARTSMARRAASRSWSA